MEQLIALVPVAIASVTLIGLCLGLTEIIADEPPPISTPPPEQQKGLGNGGEP